MPHTRQSLRLLPLLLLASILSGASLACTSNIPLIGRTITPSPTVTPTSTETPTVTPTFTPSNTPTARPTALEVDWPLVFNESFGDNRNGWMTGNYDNDFVKGSITVAGGKYFVVMTPKQAMFWWVAPNVRSLKDFFLSVDVETNSITPNAEYGLVFRSKDNYEYFFSIHAQDQTYHVVMPYKDGWTTVKNWTACPGIDPNGVNRIAVLAKGSTFFLYINGKETYVVVDSTLKEGFIGIGWILYDVGAKTELEFDNFLVRAPAN